VAGSSLLVDYILTVAGERVGRHCRHHVGVPVSASYRVEICVGFVS
jgi:hypothetical protein